MSLLNRGKFASALMRMPLPVITTDATAVTSVAGETLTLAVGGSGTTGSVVTVFGPIASLLGDRVGQFGDTSLVIASGTALVTEVSFATAANAYAAAANNGVRSPDLNEPTSDYTSALSVGQYYVVYETGRLYYKKAAAGDATVNYKYRAGQVQLTTGDIEIGAVEIKNGTDDTRAVVSTAGADAVSNTRNELEVSSRENVFNGTTWDRVRGAVVTPTATLTGFPNSLPWAVYNATPTVRTEGQGGPIQADSSGRLQIVGNIASGVADAGAPVKIGGVYNATPSTLTTAYRGDAQLDSVGNLRSADQFAPQYEDNTNAVAQMVIKPLASSTYAPTRFQNIGANATLNVKATTGNIFSVYCHNLAGADRWLQLHNTATTPGGAAVPAQSFYVPIGGVLELGMDYFTASGTNYATGIAFACSTTEGTYTAATATDHFTQIMYV